MRRLVFLFIALLVLAAGPAQAAPAGKGPVWWKISNERSTVWVLGIPEIFSSDLKWNDSALRQRISLADRVIYPSGLFTDPRMDPKLWPVLGRNALDPLGIRSNDSGNSVPSAKRFDSAFSARLNSQISQIKGITIGVNLRRLNTASIALWLERTAWPDGPMVNPAVDLAASLTPPAKSVRVQSEIPLRGPARAVINLITNANPTSFGPTYNSLPPESVQHRCLADILSLLEDPRTIPDRRAAMQAWADGDLDKALMRWPYVQYCLMGQEESASAENWWEKQVYYFKSAVNPAFDSDVSRTYVALIPFDVLMGSTGLLQYYRSIGYSVEID